MADVMSVTMIGSVRMIPVSPRPSSRFEGAVLTRRDPPSSVPQQTRAESGRADTNAAQRSATSRDRRAAALVARM
jgi:hypothetical protein